MSKFPTKGHARIYVHKEEHIQAVKDMIKEWSHYEYEYMNKNLIALWNGKVNLVYNGKFDELCIDQLTSHCLQKGILINIFCTGSYSDNDKVWYYESDINKGLEGVC